MYFSAYEITSIKKSTNICMIFFGFTFVLGLCYQLTIFCAFDYSFTARM